MSCNALEERLSKRITALNGAGQLDVSLDRHQR